MDADTRLYEAHSPVPAERISLREPYLIFLGDLINPTLSKTGKGLARWCPDRCVGQFRFERCTVDLGLPDMSVEEAARYGAQSLVIGAALIGGQIPETWLKTLEAAMAAGMDIVSGLHSRLTSFPELVSASQKYDVRLVDVRVPPVKIPVGTGRKRSGKRLLMVGTDCAVGKKYSALALTEALVAAAVPATFRATGQTGIMIAGEGIPIDAVISDFIVGAAELVSPDNHPDHWDIIEGQGSLHHPGYAPVSLGLLLGSQPDAIVVCHDASRSFIDEYPDFKLPTLEQCIDTALSLGRLTNREIRCVGVCINTHAFSDEESLAIVSQAQQRLGLPCLDPLRHDLAPIVNVIQSWKE